VRVLAASTDIGQGTTTIFAQIAAQRLGLPLDAVEVVDPDTALVPDSGPTVASRTVMVVGGLVDRACADARAALVAAGTGVAAEGAIAREAFAAAVRARVARGGSLRFERQYERPPGIAWDDETYTGDAYATYAWSVHVADVEVDADTGLAEVVDFVAVQEVGTVLHPVLAAGQIEGGVVQGIGWALYEDVVLKDGAMANHQLTNYILPTAADAAPIRVFFDERPYAHGPGGAKGLGELPMDGPAPAIAAALGQATGTVPTRLPFLPEALFDTLHPSGAAVTAPAGARGRA
jgi:CO/xanthine dehydrogenase Mo-binding subunit